MALYETTAFEAVNQRVLGSSPRGGATINKGFAEMRGLFLFGLGYKFSSCASISTFNYRFWQEDGQLLSFPIIIKYSL